MSEQKLIEQLNDAIDATLGGNAVTSGQIELAPLTQIAAALRNLPSENFKDRLKKELQRRPTMTAPITAPPTTQARFRTIAPFLIHSNAPELVDFLKTTFGAEELKRNTAGPDYGFYSEVRIGDSILMIGGGTAASHGNLSAALHVYVDDCDAAYRRALDAGAVTLMGSFGEPSDRPYGERSAFVEDAFGNYWYIATRFKSTPESREIASVLPHVHPAHARPYIDFLERAFGGKELAVIENAGRVMHAEVRIGDAVLEMGEPDDRTGIPSNGFFLFVDDVDAAYQKALTAGATAIRPPADIPYGLRSGIVRDPEGYLWWPAKWLR